jgi:MFS family permease
MHESTQATTGPDVSSRRALIPLYATAVFLYWAALYVYVPTLSVYAESKTDRLAWVGVVLSMYGLWQAVIRLPLGIAADWVGRRKPFILGGFAMAGLGALAMGLAKGLPGLVIGRSLTGFAAGSWVLLVVAFSSLFPPEQAVKASAILSVITSVARLIATGLTGSLNSLGGYSLAFFVAVGAAGAAMLVMLLVKEPRGEMHPVSIKQVVAFVSQREVLLPALLATVLMYGVWSSSFGFTPNLAKRLGAGDQVLSLLTTLYVGVVMAGNFLTSATVEKIGERTLVVVGFSSMALGLTSLALARSVPLVFAGQVLMGMSAGVGYPVLMGLSIRDVEESKRATAMGFFQAVYAIGMFSGPWLSGILADAIGLSGMFGLTAIGCFALGLFGAFKLAPRRR